MRWVRIKNIVFLLFYAGWILLLFHLAGPDRELGNKVGCNFFAALLVPVILQLGIAFYLSYACWKTNKRAVGREFKTFGFMLLFLILLAIALPNFIPFNPRPYNASAQSAGYHAKMAQEILYYETGGPFTDDLTALLQWDKNLTYDPQVTFIFGQCNASGFTFTTQHMQKRSQFIFTESSGEPPPSIYP